jgi:hypothetical protein
MASHPLSHDHTGDDHAASNDITDLPENLNDYLDELSDHLPTDVIDELADGLTETWHQHLAAGLAPTDAARAAIAAFGIPHQTIAAFVTHAPGRRIARALLATGPIMALCWGPGLIAAHAWAWPITTTAKTGYVLTLVAVVAALIAAATTRHSLRRARLGAAGALGLIVLDAAMLAAAASNAPVLAGPIAAAILASLTRIALTLRALPAALTH